MSVNRAGGVDRVRGTAPECRHMWALIDSLTDEDPPPSALEEIAEHFTRCASCLEAEASLEELLALYRSQSAAALPAQLEERLLDCLCGSQESGLEGAQGN